jgi:hypothetical protein
MICRSIFGLVIGVFAGLALSGCASEDSAGRFLVQPDKYTLYNCKELAEAAQANATRQHELEALMAKAGPDSGGRLVSNLAYRPEYTQLHGEMNELHRTTLEKNCRTVTGSGTRTSDQAVR